MTDINIISAEALAQNEDILPAEIAMLLDSNTPVSNNDKKGKNKSKPTSKNKKEKKPSKKKTVNELQKDMEETIKNHKSSPEKFNVGDDVVYVKMREGTIVDRFDDGSGTVDYTVEMKDDNCVISTSGTKYLIMDKDNDKKNGNVKYTKCLFGKVTQIADDGTYVVLLSNSFSVHANEIDIMKPDDYNMFSQDD